MNFAISVIHLVSFIVQRGYSCLKLRVKACVKYTSEIGLIIKVLIKSHRHCAVGKYLSISTMVLDLVAIYIDNYLFFTVRQSTALSSTIQHIIPVFKINQLRKNRVASLNFFALKMSNKVVCNTSTNFVTVW